MKLLVVSPDYASHVEPMLQVAIDWKRRIGPVTVATGPTVRRSVEAGGLDWTLLQLGRGSNAGIIRTDEQPRGENEHLQQFFDATRAGAVATLRYQAVARRHDLLFEPDRVLADLRRIIADVRPDRVLVDHVAFGARLALYALGVEPATLVLGHPTALPAPGELYGLPPAWPTAISPSDAELAILRHVCAVSTRELTDASNELLRRVDPSRPMLDDLTSLAGHPTLYMYPGQLHDPARQLPTGSISVGSLRRKNRSASSGADDLPAGSGDPAGDVLTGTDPLTPVDQDPPTGADPVAPVERDLPTGSGPLVLVALGTFLSARSDVLAPAVGAAHDTWRLALASGSTPVDALGPLPPGSLVRDHLPQVALLEHADVLITHGGNNSVTEACAAGVPMVVLPMSTDQFAGAAALERAGIGIALDPNTLTVDDLRSAVHSVLSSDAAERVSAIARSIADHGGPSAAVDAIVG